MTLTEVRVYDSMRPQGLRKEGKTGKTKRQFTPNDAQIICAMRRIEGMLNKYHGTFACYAAKDRVHKELVGGIYSRGSGLGEKPDEICETLRLALERLTSEGKVYLEENTQGQLYLILKSPRQGRVHKDKYQQKRSGQRSRTRMAA